MIQKLMKMKADMYLNTLGKITRKIVKEHTNIKWEEIYEHRENFQIKHIFPKISF